MEENVRHKRQETKKERKEEKNEKKGDEGKKVNREGCNEDVCGTEEYPWQSLEGLAQR